MEKIRDIVEGLIKRLETQKDYCGRSPEDLLKKILDKRERRHVRINNLRGGILTLWVDSSSWLYHFGLKKTAILAKIKNNNDKIKDIRFCLGKPNAEESK